MRKLMMAVLAGVAMVAEAQFYTSVPGPDATDRAIMQHCADTQRLCADIAKMTDFMNKNGGQLPSVAFLNCTQHTIRSIYITPVSYGSYDVDVLNGSTLDSQDMTTITFNGGDVVYNIRVVFTNGQYVDFSRNYVGSGVRKFVLTQTGDNSYNIAFK